MAGLEIEIGPPKKPMFGGKGGGFGDKSAEPEDDNLEIDMMERFLDAADSGDSAQALSALKALVRSITSENSDMEAEE